MSFGILFCCFCHFVTPFFQIHTENLSIWLSFQNKAAVSFLYTTFLPHSNMCFCPVTSPFCICSSYFILSNFTENWFSIAAVAIGQQFRTNHPLYSRMERQQTKTTKCCIFFLGCRAQIGAVIVFEHYLQIIYGNPR